MNPAVGKGPGWNQLPPVQLHQLTHFVLETVGKYQAFHLIVLLDAVIFPGGVDHPVPDVHQVQQIPELLLRQFNVHWATPPSVHSIVAV